MRSTRVISGIAVLAAVCVALTTAGARAGATFTVDTTTDAHDAAPGDGVCAVAGGGCSLRAAVEEADALAGADTIDVPGGTYVLTLGELQVSSSDGVTIDGAGTGSTSVSAGGVNVFLPGHGANRILQLGAGAGATLADLELTGGGDSAGGAVQSAGALGLDGVLLDGNAASNSGGAVLETAGSLTVSASDIESNAAGGNFGGGIAIQAGTATITGSTVDDNTVGFAGGGIYSNGTLTLTDTDVDANAATGANNGAGGIESAGEVTISGGTIDDNTTNGTGHGGGIHVAANGSIDGTTIAGNTAGQGGGIYVDGTLTLTDATVDGNHARVGGAGTAGGIDNEGTLTMTGTSVTNNDTDGSGGALFNSETATLTNDTISGNTAGVDAGGLLDDGTLTLLSDTIADNGPDGLTEAGAGQIDLTDTIAAGQRSGDDCASGAAVVSHGHNLDSDGTCSLAASGDLSSVDPLLDTLADNGGPTKTRALRAGSPAIDAGAGCPATDQRGVSRSGACDIGAYELVAPAPPPATTTTQTPPPAQQSADLGVTGAFLPSSATPQSPVTLTATVTNAGPADADSVVVALTLPGSLTVEATPAGCTATDAGLACVVGGLAAGGTAALVFRLQSPADGSTVTVGAHVGGDQPDPNQPNDDAAIVLGSGCAKQLTVDAVTVLADCIVEQTDGTLLAQGDTRFSQGVAIDAPLVIDPASHTISLQSGASSTLVAGGRAVASGPLVVHTDGTQQVDGVQHVLVALSGWTFADDLASTDLQLLSAANGGGVLLTGTLTVPLYVASPSGTITVQVDASGHRIVQSGEIGLSHFTIPFTPWAAGSLELSFLDGGDEFTGHATLNAGLLGNIALDSLVIRKGKLASFAAHYDGTACGECGPSDPKLGTLARLKYAQLTGLNLLKIPYTQSSLVLPCVINGCAPPQIAGRVVIALYNDRIIGLTNFQYFLSGRFHADGRVFYAPTLPASFNPPYAQGVTPYLAFAKQGIDFATAFIDFTPPSRYDLGGTFQVAGDFLIGNMTIGFDPPHFTGEGGLTLKIPDESPIFGGKKIAGVEALISDKAAAAQVDIKVCIKYIGCAKTFFAAAYLWNGHFVFQEPVDNFRTVSAVESDRSPAGATRGPLAIPSGWKLAVVKVTSAGGVPNVRLTSPGGRTASSATSSAIGNETGALVSTSAPLHEETFLLALPEAGRWQLTPLGGGAITGVEVARGLVEPTLVPHAGDLPEHAASGAAVRLRWQTRDAGPGTTVDLWAGASRSGAGAIRIAGGLPASGATTWHIPALQSGRYVVWAVLVRRGIPEHTVAWPGAIEIVDRDAPAPPRTLAFRRVHGGAVVSWRRVQGAASYAVFVHRAGGSTVEVDTARPSASIRLLPRRRYTVTVRSIGANELRGAASKALRIR